jgi:hypothetical protein
MLDGRRGQNPHEGRKVPEVSTRIGEYPSEHRIGGECQRDDRDSTLDIGG